MTFLLVRDGAYACVSIPSDALPNCLRQANASIVVATGAHQTGRNSEASRRETSPVFADRNDRQNWTFEEPSSLLKGTNQQPL